MHNIVSLLANDNYIVVNRDIAHLLGLDAAILLGELCAQANKHQTEWFYLQQKKIEENTTLTPYKQREALEVLQKHKLVSMKKEGLPAKNYYKIEQENLCQIFNNKMLKNLTTGGENFKQQNNNDNNSNVHSVHSSPSPDGEVDSFSTLTKGQSLAETLNSLSDAKRAAVDEFVKMRKLIKKPMTPHALELTLNKLNKMTSDEKEQIAILEQSIANSWQGIFPLKENNKTAPADDFDYEDLPKSFRKIYEQQGLHWKASLPRICRSVTDLQFWYKAKREDEKFTKKNLGSSWDGLRFSAQSFWDSFLSYISDVIGDKQPQPAFFDPNGNMLNSWAREMEIEL